jgi:thymidylate synthase (FAD)
MADGINKGIITQIKVLDKGFVRLDDMMQAEIKAVNAARVSFSSKSDYLSEDKYEEFCQDYYELTDNEYDLKYPHEKYGEEYRDYFKNTNKDICLKPKDFKLLKYLIKEKHHSPLRHSYMTFHVKVPIAINAQWIKHQVGCNYSGDGWNQISHRYIDGTKDKTKFEFYFPDGFRKQSTDNRQASLDETIDPILNDIEWGEYNELSRDIDEDGKVIPYLVKGLDVFQTLTYEAFRLYESLVSEGVAKEQARMILPQNVYTEFYWTCSLQAVLNFLSLRKHSGAQYEIRKYAEAIEQLLEPHFPASIYLWQKYGG